VEDNPLALISFYRIFNIANFNKISHFCYRQVRCAEINLGWIWTFLIKIHSPDIMTEMFLGIILYSDM
jgi:hypothetical protein